jgi:hypothetical protein
MSQKYKLVEFSNEGVRLNGKAIHPQVGKPIICSPSDVLEFRDGFSDCKIEPINNIGEVWVGLCCCKEGERSLSIKKAFRVKQRHLDRHKETGEPINTTVMFNSDMSKQKLFYRCLGDHPTIDSIGKYESNTIYDTDTTRVSFREELVLGSKHLVAKNKGEEVLFAVTYVLEGYTIRRLGLVEIPPKREEELGVTNDLNGVFYVFYSNDSDPVWDCLSLDDKSIIKCRKIISN